MTFGRPQVSKQMQLIVSVVEQFESWLSGNPEVPRVVVFVLVVASDVECTNSLN